MTYRFNVIQANSLPTTVWDEPLSAVDSNETRSIYTYRCGCVAIRRINSDYCSFRWCAHHHDETHSPV